MSRFRIVFFTVLSLVVFGEVALAQSIWTGPRVPSGACVGCVRG